MSRPLTFADLRRRLAERAGGIAPLPTDRAAAPREMRAYARGVIGLEIMDRVQARRRYSPEGVALLAAAVRLLDLPAPAETL